MQPDSPSDALAADVLGFLDAALIEVVPERDVPASEALCRRMVESWPPDDAGWAAARARLAATVAEHLRPRPKLWGRALHLAGLYLSGLQLDEPHPQQEPGGQLFIGERSKYRVRFHLARGVARVLIEASDATDVVALFEGLEERRAWFAAAEAFAEAKPALGPDEVVRLFESARRSTSLGSSLTYDALFEGLVASKDAVTAIIQGWLDAESAFINVDLSDVGELARWHLSRRVDANAQRRRLIAQLARTRDARASRIALTLAFRSWPAETALRDRKVLLVDTLSQIGSSGVPSALLAVLRDPEISVETQFEEVIDLFDTVMNTLSEPSPDSAGAALMILEWLTVGLSGERSRPRADALVDRLPSPDQVLLSQSTQLDWTLEKLVLRRPDAIRAYLLDWLEAHHADLRKIARSPSDLLPITWERLGDPSWLIEAAASERPALRLVALRALIEHHPTDVMVAGISISVPQAGYDGLSPQQVVGLAHLILSQPGLGEGCIELLITLARARVDCLPELRPLLGEPAMQTYPGRHERAVRAWVDAVLDRADDDAEKQMVVALVAEIDQRAQSLAARRELGPLLFDHTRRVSMAARELFQRRMHEEMSAQQQGSLLLQFATRVPMACGEASSFDVADDPARVSRLAEIRTEWEGLSLQGYDPVRATIARLHHMQEANRLLDASERGA